MIHCLTVVHGLALDCLERARLDVPTVAADDDALYRYSHLDYLQVVRYPYLAVILSRHVLESPVLACLEQRDEYGRLSSPVVDLGH